jgi:hypothetical protein
MHSRRLKVARRTAEETAGAPVDVVLIEVAEKFSSDSRETASVKQLDACRREHGSADLRLLCRV